MKIFAGYAGEFGWEVATFYPRIAWLAEQGHDIELHTYPAVFFMYEDLGIKLVDNKCEGRACGDGKNGHFPEIPPQDADTAIWIPKDVRSTLKLRVARSEREIRTDIKPTKDLQRHFVVHARTFKKKTARNWRPEHTESLEIFAGMGYKIYFIGDPNFTQAFPELGEDIRGHSAEECLGVIKSATGCFGPSSGAVVLAQWCGCPIFTWSDNSARTFIERNRWTQVWNPRSVASYHPWSNNPTEGNLKYYSHMQCRPSVDQLKSGIKFMLKDMVWNREGFTQ